MTYAGFKQAAERVALAIQQCGLQEGDRAAILMSNQSKWLIGAYAIFYIGGVVVPIDFKLTAAEQLPLLAHARVRVLIVEYPLWRNLTQVEGFVDSSVPFVVVTEAPPKANLNGARRWEDSPGVANSWNWYMVFLLPK